MRAKRKKGVNKTYFLIFSLVFLISVIIVSFLVGLHWHGTIVRKIPPKKLTCQEHNNFWETYQIDCYSPLTEKQKNFIFSNRLTCSLLTNNQLMDVDKKYEKKLPKSYHEIVLIKTDYVNFTLDFDLQNNEIIRSREPGEPMKNPYEIIQNDENIISAIRKNKFDDFFGYEYQYIMLSKKTGKGISTWANTEDFKPDSDSINTEFFQCE